MKRDTLAAIAAGAALGAAMCLGLVYHPKPAPASSVAVSARLIGSCGGQIYAGQEESDFPQGCDWIEPIRAN